MSLTRQIAGNTVIQVAGKFIGTLLGLVTVGIMTRHLGQSGYGQFTTVMSFLQFFGILVDFGLTLTMMKMISEKGADEERLASNIFTLRLVSGLVFFGAAPLIALFFPYPTAVKAGIALGALSFLNISLSQVLLGLFQKHLAVHRATISEVAGRTLLLLGAFAAANFGGGLLSFVAALVAANLFQFILNFLFSRPYVRIRLAFEWTVWKRIISESWPIGMSIAFNLIYLKGDILVLSVFRSQEEIGLYGASYKILDVITVVPMIFMGLVLPVLAAAWSGGKREDFSRKLGKAFDFMSILALPLAFGTGPVARDLMRFVAGDAFADSGNFLSILMLAGAAVFWSALFGHAIVALGLQRKMIWAYAVDAIISLVLYIVFIPRVGAIGAAWVTVFSEGFIAVITAVAVVMATRAAPPLRTFWKAAVSAALMGAILSMAAPLHVLLRILLGIASYFFILAALGGISRESLWFLRRSSEAT